MLAVYNVGLPPKEWLVSVARGMRNSYNSWDKMDTYKVGTVRNSQHSLINSLKLWRF